MAIALPYTSPPTSDAAETVSFLPTTDRSDTAAYDKKAKHTTSAALPITTGLHRQRLVDYVHTLRLPWNGTVPLISGLDRILLTSKPPPPASDVILLGGVQPPRYLWYMLSGALCDVLQISSLVVLHQMISDGTVCWCLGFLLSIPARHASHRYLVFGDYVGGYYPSLLRMYTGYSVIIVLSTAFNFVMARIWLTTVPVTWLWCLTLVWTGVANYFILKYCWSYGGNPASLSSSSKKEGSSTTIAAHEMVIRTV